VKDGTIARGAQRRVCRARSLKEWKTEPASPPSRDRRHWLALDLASYWNLRGQKPDPGSRRPRALGARIGTVGALGNVDFQLTKGVAYDEPFDRRHANVDSSPPGDPRAEATLSAGPGSGLPQRIVQPKTPFRRRFPDISKTGGPITGWRAMIWRFNGLRGDV